MLYNHKINDKTQDYQINDFVGDLNKMYLAINRACDYLSIITTFNEKFQVYEGTNLKGTTVKGLLTTIARNNGLDNSDDILNSEGSTANHLIKEINFNGEEYEVNEQNINFIKNEMKLDGYYRVEFEMDEESGAIYRAVINEKVG